MAKTISNLLVGIGFDLDKKSTDKVSSGIDSVKSKAIKLGTVVAGAFGIKALTVDFASAKDDLGKFSEVMGVSADNVHAFGNALRLEGGTLNSFMSQLEGIERFRAGFKVGDIGFLPAAEKAGIDTKTILQAKDAAEAYLTLADQFQKLSRQQRINAAQAMGLDDASIRLLSKGRKAVEAVIAQQKKMRPITAEMTDGAAKFNDEFQDLQTNLGGFADLISTRLLPQINNVVKGFNDWTNANRALVNVGLDVFLGNVEKKLPSILDALLKGLPTFALSTVFGSGEEVAATGTRPDFLKRATQATNPAVVTRPNINRTTTTKRNVPIVIHNNLTMDGKVIDSKVVKVVGEMADQAIQALSSTEGG